jgi:hypothetical protein
MSRAIITSTRTPQVSQAFPTLATEPTDKSDEAPKPQEKEDKYSDRLVKYVPTEVIALYLAVTAAITADSSAPPFLYWVIFAACLVGTWLYLRVAQKVNSSLQLSISTFAFAVWAFALGGPFAELSWYKPIYGAVLLPIVTFFVGVIKPNPPNA